MHFYKLIVNFLKVHYGVGAADKTVSGSVSTLWNPPHTLPDKSVTVWDRSAIWVTRKWYKTDHIFCMTSMQKTHNNNKTLTERFTPNAKIDLFLSHHDISDKTISRGVFYIIIVRPCKFYVNFVFISVLLLTKMWCFFKFRSAAAMKNLITCYAPKIE